MAAFAYTFQTKIGVQSGECEAETLEGAILFLKKQKITPLKIKPKPKDLFESLGGGGPTEKDIVIFVRQFATMINAGLPLVQCLEILGPQATNRVFGRAINDIRTRIEQGDTFADALRRHPKIFDELFSNMVEAGEVGGILDTILLRLAAYIEKAAALKSKIKSAMVYPASIVVIASAVIGFLLIFIIPQFGSMFAEMGGRQLPAVTRSVIFLSNGLIHYWYIFAGVPVAVFFGLKKMAEYEKGKHIQDRVMMRMPVMGELMKKIGVSKFTRTMGTLVASGVPIIEALDIVARTAGNKVIEYAIVDTIDDIKQGKGLADPLRAQGIFPPMVVQMIEVGEHTGALDTMLTKIADFYDQEVDDAVDALTSLMEPLLMAFLGVVVGYVVIAMYMPIFQMGAGAN
ncbi:MAG: type II secretion system F family protein [Nitrospinota bacterium]